MDLMINVLLSVLVLVFFFFSARLLLWPELYAL